MVKTNIKKAKDITGSYDDWLNDRLKDPEIACMHIQAAMTLYEEDQDKESLMLALKDVVNANGGIGQLAKGTQLNRENLYRLLSGKANPRLDTMVLILKVLGLHLKVSAQ